MQLRGTAGRGLTYDATNIEECGQVPSLLGSEVNCGKRSMCSDLGTQGRHNGGPLLEVSRQTPDPGSLPPSSEEGVGAGEQRLAKVTGECSSLGWYAHAGPRPVLTSSSPVGWP